MDSGNIIFCVACLTAAAVPSSNTPRLPFSPDNRTCAVPMTPSLRQSQRRRPPCASSITLGVRATAESSTNVHEYRETSCVQRTFKGRRHFYVGCTCLECRRRRSTRPFSAPAAGRGWESKGDKWSVGEDIAYMGV